MAARIAVRTLRFKRGLTMLQEMDIYRAVDKFNIENRGWSFHSWSRETFFQSIIRRWL